MATPKIPVQAGPNIIYEFGDILPSTAKGKSQETHLKANPDDGDTELIFDLTDYPVDISRVNALRVSSTLGELWDIDVTLDGTQVTARLASGVQFAASDTVYISYLRRLVA